MADIDESNSVYPVEKEYLDEGLTDEKAEDTEKARKEWMELMVHESKPHFSNI